ncbi:MAG: hypothetical protein IJ645_05145, partial [Ruminococcus sp.]|nr:hypothetical protein [Ruminococcus sp.]
KEKAAADKAAAEKKTEEVKAVAKKAATATKTKAAAAKTAVKAKADTAKKKAAEKKTAAKKPAAKKAAAKDEVFVQVEGVNEINVAAVVDAAKADYKAKSGKAAKAVTVYVKPAEGVAYYTVAGKGSDDYKVDL